MFIILSDSGLTQAALCDPSATQGALRQICGLFMSHQAISATTLARNFSELLNRVRYQGLTLDVTRGSEVIACITPPGPSGGFPIAQLDRALAALPQLSADEAIQFHADIAAVRARLKQEGDAWAS